MFAHPLDPIMIYKYLGNICSNVPFLSVLYLINVTELEMVVSYTISHRDVPKIIGTEFWRRTHASLIMNYFSIPESIFVFKSDQAIAGSN